jgi:hypothetical protein
MNNNDTRRKMSITNFGINSEQLKKAHSAREFVGKRPTVLVAGGIQRYGQVLPDSVVNGFTHIKNSDDRDNYIKALASVGWTGRAIAVACKMSAERVYQIIASGAQTMHTPATLMVPPAPRKMVKEKIVTTYTEPAPEMLARMRELQPLAQLVRSSSPRYRAEAEEYTYLLNEATKQGCTVYRLAKLLGVTHSALAFRLVRYGYRSTVHGQTKAYQPVMHRLATPSV